MRQDLQDLQQQPRVLSASLTARSGRCVVASATRRLRGGQHHDRQRRAGARGDVLGVAGEGDAGLVDQALLHRRGHHGRELAGQAAVHRAIDQLPAPGGALRTLEPPGSAGRRQRLMQHAQRAGARGSTVATGA